MSSSDQPQEKPKRRVRYKGTHPRSFHEKYKELNPEKYDAELEKVKARGNTPVGTHIPICVQEIISILRPHPGKVYVDATLGYGGHSWEILRRIAPNGKLYSFDQDPIERVKTTERLQKRIQELELPADHFVVGGINFAQARNFLRQQGVSAVDGLLADLGLSSMQIDTPERGFSFKVDAPFDLRMNPQKGEPAWVQLRKMTEQQIRDLLRDNADEPHAQQIAQQLLRDLPETTTQVAASVGKVLQHLSTRQREQEGDAPIRRVFQAFRIDVNKEYEALDQLLEILPDILRPGACAAILTFHSGEDRRVKKSFQALQRAGVYSEIAEEPLRPSPQEQRENPRSKSAKLRWAQKG